MRKIKVCILDSGLDPKSSVGKEIGFSGGLEIVLDDSKNFAYKYDAIDDIGHGTAVAIIKRLNNDIDITPIKIVRNGVQIAQRFLSLR